MRIRVAIAVACTLALAPLSSGTSARTLSDGTCINGRPGAAFLSKERALARASGKPYLVPTRFPTSSRFAQYCAFSGYSSIAYQPSRSDMLHNRVLIMSDSRTVGQEVRVYKLTHVQVERIGAYRVTQGYRVQGNGCQAWQFIFNSRGITYDAFASEHGPPGCDNYTDSSARPPAVMRTMRLA